MWLNFFYTGKQGEEMSNILPDKTVAAIIDAVSSGVEKAIDTSEEKKIKSLRN